MVFCYRNPRKLNTHSSSVQSLSHVRLFVTSWTAACQASLPVTNSWNLPKLMSIDSVMPSNHLILCHLLLLPLSIFPRIRVFSNKSVLRIRWLKYWSFCFNISPSIFRTDFLYHGLAGSLCSQGTLKNPNYCGSPTPQFKSINSLVLGFLHSPTLISIHRQLEKP